MKLHVIRHGQAIERSTALPDEQRNLTCRGRKKFRKVAACLKKMAIAPEYILTSRLIRAVQTAEILSETIRFKGELQICPELAGGPDSAALGALLKARSSADEIVIVGHEPDLGELVRKLLRLPAPCNIPKGCVVTLEIAQKKLGLTAELISMVTGSGKAIQKPAKARERLLGENHTCIKEEAP